MPSEAFKRITLGMCLRVQRDLANPTINIELEGGHWSGIFALHAALSAR